MVSRFLIHFATVLTLILGLGEIFGFRKSLVAWTQNHSGWVVLIMIGYAIWWAVIHDWKRMDREAKFRHTAGRRDDERER